MPGGDAGLEFHEHLEPRLFHHDSNVEVRSARNKIASRATAVKGYRNQFIGKEVAQFLNKLDENFFSLRVKHTRLGATAVSSSIRSAWVRVNVSRLRKMVEVL